MAKPRLRDRMEFLLSKGLEASISRLPEAAARGLGAALGAMARRPLGIRRHTVDQNLRRAFPDADEAWIASVTRDTYRHLGREAIEMIRLSHMTREEVIAATEIPELDWNTLQEAYAERRGVLLVTGHYGNWEAAAAAVAARGLPIDAIVKRQRNRLVDAQIEAARNRLGIGLISMGEASTKVMRSLAKGRVVGIVGDQDARRAGVFVPFFGVASSTYRGPAMFALRLRVPLIAAVARRLPDGRYRVEGKRIPARSSGDMEADVYRVTAAIAAHLEEEIRKEPGQYFWFHKRWKTLPPGELRGDRNGTSMPAAAGIQSAVEQKP